LTNASRVLLLWAAVILTRPIGDYLDKPVALSRPHPSAVIAGFIILCLFILPQRAGRHPQAPEAVRG
jgi:uncharacterized membrane-anchored protein